MQSETPSHSTLGAAAAGMFAKLNRSGALDRLRKAVEAKMTGDDRRMEQIQRRTEENLKEGKERELHKLDTKMLLAQTRRKILTAELEEDVRMDVANAMGGLALRNMFNEEVSSLKSVGQASKAVSEEASLQSAGGRALLAKFCKYPTSKGKVDKGVERKDRGASVDKSNVVGNVRAVRKAVGGEDGKFGRDSASRGEGALASNHKIDVQGKGISAAAVDLSSVSAKEVVRDGGEVSVARADTAENGNHAGQTASAWMVSKVVVSGEERTVTEKKDVQLSEAVTRTHAQEERTTRTASDTCGDLTLGDSMDITKATTLAEKPLARPAISISQESPAETDRMSEESLVAKLMQKTATAEKDTQVDEVGAVLRPAQEAKEILPPQPSDTNSVVDQGNEHWQGQQGNKSIQVICDCSSASLPKTVEGDAMNEETRANDPEKRAAEEKELESSSEKSSELPAPTSKSTEDSELMGVDVQKTAVLEVLECAVPKSIIDTTPKKEPSRPMLEKEEAKHDVEADGDTVSARDDDTTSKTANIFAEGKSVNLTAQDSDATDAARDVTSKGCLVSPTRLSLYESKDSKDVKTENDACECPGANGARAVEKSESMANSFGEYTNILGCRSSQTPLASNSLDNDSEQKSRPKSGEQAEGMEFREEGLETSRKGLVELKVASGRVCKSTKKRHDSNIDERSLRKLNRSKKPMSGKLCPKLEKGELVIEGDQEREGKEAEQQDINIGEKSSRSDKNLTARKPTKRRRDEHTDLKANVLKKTDTDILSPTCKRPRTPLRNDLCIPQDYDEQRKILRALSNLSEAPHACPFLDPVDPNDAGCENYYDVITNPMNVYKITKRLRASTPKAGYYASVDNVMQDIELIWSNCRKFNGDYDPVVKDAERCINTLDILLEREGLRKAASGRAKRRRSRTKLRSCHEDDKRQPREKSHEIRPKVGTPKLNRLKEKEKVELKISSGVNDGRLVGKFVFVFTEVGSKKAWVEVKVMSFEEDSHTYTVKWKETEKTTNKADFGSGCLYPVYRMGRQG